MPGRGPEGGGYRPPEEEGPQHEKHDREQKLPPAPEATTIETHAAPAKPPEAAAELVASRELGGYTRAELVAEVRGFISNMEAQAGKDRLKEVLKALWEKLDDKERAVFAKRLGEIIKKLQKEGQPLVAIFATLTEALTLVLPNVKKRKK